MLVGHKIISFAPEVRFSVLLLHFIYFTACDSRLSGAILWLLLFQPLLNISIHTCKPSKENTERNIRFHKNRCCKYQHILCLDHGVQLSRTVKIILDGIHVRIPELYENLAGWFRVVSDLHLQDVESWDQLHLHISHHKSETWTKFNHTTRIQNNIIQYDTIRYEINRKILLRSRNSDWLQCFVHSFTACLWDNMPQQAWSHLPRRARWQPRRWHF